ncbi:MAG: strawberry notch C-terminal domain-containing protein, partial [Planctomycetota bacterium]
MIAAIKAGGEPFQEVISAALAQTAFYVRTELDFSGVDYQTLVDAQHIDRDKWRADQVADVLRDILAFDELIVKGLIDRKNRTAKAIARATTSLSTTITHASFASIAWNAIKQMLLALKIDETVEQTKQAIKEGRRVVIAIENTMESFLKRYIEARSIQPGEKLVDFDYRNVLESLLESTLRMRIIHPSGRQEVVGLGHLKSDVKYQRILEKIRGLTELQLPGSPIDEIISRLEAEGIKVGEITGRDNRITKRGKDYILDRRARVEKDKTSAAYKFNNGDIQVLITNVSGAEGISLHSSAKFKNQEPRRMIVAQPAGDINVFVQLLGRTNRKAQVAPPEYR